MRGCCLDVVHSLLHPFAVSVACLQYRSWMRFGVRKPLKTSSYPAYVYINFGRSLTFYYDSMKFTASTGLYKIPASKGPAGESVKFDGTACGCWFPSCSCRLHWHRQVLPCRHNKHKDQGSRVVPHWDDSLAARPCSPLLKKKTLASALVFLPMFYHGVPCHHVHCDSDTGPAFLFWLLVPVSTLQLHK